MIYALDTNIISFLLRPSRNPEVVREYQKMVEQGDRYVIPPLCHYEIMWHLLWKNAAAQVKDFELIYLDSLAKIQMDEDSFRIAAEMKASLMKKGTPVGNADILIAAYCVANGYTLVTDNISDFERIEGLDFVNWKSQQ
jgi:predicted nucleic acid-binding protein